MAQATTTKKRLHELVDELSEQEADATLEFIALRRKNGVSSKSAARSKKVGRLSFFAIGAGAPADAARRADELVGSAIARRHPVT